MASMAEALGLLSAETWEVQETAYRTLVMLIRNPLENPDDPKFRSVKRDDAALKSKLLDRPGGAQALLAAGFQEESDAYVLAADVPLDSLRTALETVQSHEKIAKAKAEQAKLDKLGDYTLGGSSSTASAPSAASLPAPVTDAFCIDDPRHPGGKVGLIAFYYPGREEPWDRICKAGFLGNFFLQPQGEEIRLAPPSFPRQEHSFTNAEAAFQALKLWKRANEFLTADGGAAFELKMWYYEEADLTYSGYGSNWSAMLAVLQQKFAPGTACAQALVATGDAFLLEHNSVSGRDEIWSDNQNGDGMNLLGLQLMLLRDNLRKELAGVVDEETSWTTYAKSQVNLDTGELLSGQWQKTVQAAANLVNARM